jgi:hypothetical protein
MLQNIAQAVILEVFVDCILCYNYGIEKRLIFHYCITGKAWKYAVTELITGN